MKRHLHTGMFLSPLVLLYFSCFVLASVSTGFSLSASLQAKGWLYFPALMLAYFFLATVVLLYRPLLLDLTTALQYRERFGIFLIHLVFVMFPSAVFRHSNFILGLAFLNIPLFIFLLRPHNFCNFYLNNLMIFLIGLFYVSRPPVLILFLFSGVLLSTFILDYFAFRIEKYRNIIGKFDLRTLTTPLLGGILLVTIGYTLLLLLTPRMTPQQLKFIELTPAGELRYSAPKPLDESEIVELAINVLILIIITFLLLAILNWLNKKLRRYRQQKPVLKTSATFAHFKKMIKEAFSKAYHIRLDNPRSAVIYYYNLFCEEMERVGLGRARYVTPKEYEDLLRQKVQTHGEALHSLRQEFELAKYSPADITDKVAQNYQRQVFSILDVIKQRLEEKREK
ncbi:DUF4129 domain-containing protein [Candidatus Sumerlaeota bacterium]|nr:DUF4129 domain-containing protein [Candidatus Sumerlaeota bacterium]